MHVFLIGFMAAGKSTVGRLLADAWQRPFVDLDRQIEQDAGATIAEIFEQRGEEAFRDLEAAALAALAERTEACVVATGGGLPVRPDNRRQLRRAGVSIWLHLPFETLRERALRQPTARPLFRDPEAARLLFEQRVEYYREADHRLDVAPTELPATTAERIRRLVDSASEGGVVYDGGSGRNRPRSGSARDTDSPEFCHPGQPQHSEEERHCAI